MMVKLFKLKHVRQHNHCHFKNCIVDNMDIDRNCRPISSPRPTTVPMH